MRDPAKLIPFPSKRLAEHLEFSEPASAGGLNFALADGSVRWINDAIELRVYRELAMIDGRELIGDDDWR